MRRRRSTISTIVLRPMWITLKHLFKKRPVTVMYPKEKLEQLEKGMFGAENIWYRYKGAPALTDRCVGCGLCSRICPNRCIELVIVEEKKKRPKIDLGRCMFCGFCEEYCPKNALILTTNYEVAEYTKEDLVYTPERMRANLKYIKHKDLKFPKRAKEFPKAILELCIGCGLCAKNCPVNALTMIERPKEGEEKKPKKMPKLDISLCISCGTCVEKCKKNAMSMEITS